MDSSADCIERKLYDQSYSLCDRGHEEGKDQLDLFMTRVFIYDFGAVVEKVLIDVDVESCGDEGVREGEDHSSIESLSLFFERLFDEGHSGDQRFSFGSFESSGDGIDWVECEICYPGEDSRCQSRNGCVME